ncbi:ABC transporter permease [Paenibacillaceae bacterium]|nr:ABC transporter permease [Paenibacillaceae bacterium]
MLNLIQADLYKLGKSKAIKVLFAITTLSAALMAVMAYLIPQGKIKGSMTGIGFMFSDVNMISILGAVIAGVFICGDFDNKTIHDAIANGCSRGAVIVSKAAVFCCAITIILMPYVLITGIALGTGSEFSMGSLAVGFLNILTTESSSTLSAAAIWKLLIVIMTLIIVYLAQLSICVPLAFLLKKPVLVVAIYYVFTIFCAQLTGLGDSYPVIDHIFDWTPYGGSYTFVVLDTVPGDIIQAIATSLVFIVVMVAITYMAFRKSEIK